jgi:hypothetical protein
MSTVSIFNLEIIQIKQIGTIPIRNVKIAKMKSFYDMEEAFQC